MCSAHRPLIQFNKFQRDGFVGSWTGITGWQSQLAINLDRFHDWRVLHRGHPDHGHLIQPPMSLREEPDHIGAALSPSASSADVISGVAAHSASAVTAADNLVHHVHAFTIHVTAQILLKAILGFRFPCDGPGRGGTSQSPIGRMRGLEAWDG